MTGDALPYITLFPVLFAVAFFAGLGPTVLATAAGGVAAWFLFFPTMAGPGYPAMGLGVPLFALSGVLIGWLGESRLRALRQAAEAVRTARRETSRAEDASRRAEIERARSEREAERTERVLESITDALLVLGPDWRITYMNERAAVLFGRSGLEYRGLSHDEVFPEATGPRLEEACRQAAGSGQVARTEAFQGPADRWLQATVYPSPDGLTVIIQDVSDRVLANEVSTRLAAIVASSEDAIIGKQLDGTITSWNAAAERIFGYSAAEMVGQSIYRLIPPHLHHTEREVLRRLAAGERIEFSEAERIRADGRRIYIALSVSPIRNPDGRVIGASSIKRDVTVQKATREALAAESARSRSLAQALDATQALVREPGGKITYWSSGSARLYGWTETEALGRSAQDLLRTESAVPRAEIEHSLLARGQWEGELVQTARDGRRVYVAAQWVLRQEAAGEPALVIEVHTDVSARREAEERIRQSERMEVVGQLAGGVAHEANNQMTVVLGAADFLLRQPSLTEAARRDIEHIRAAAERTAAITAQLLAFSRRQVLQPQQLDLNEAVEALKPVLQRALGERSSLSLGLNPAPARIRADPGQLAQVLLNLVLNARDAMPAGGRVTIETAITALTARYAEVHPEIDVRPGPYAVLSVSDTGHGMTPDTMRRIFEPFFTTKEIGKGTGLGLATVYGIVKQSDGYVWVYSEVGQGTTFRVYLPLATEAGVRVAAGSAPVRGTGERVLLVEDEPSVRQMTARALREHGFSVEEAAGGAEALTRLEAVGSPFDAIVTDVVMPGMDGPELARRARAIQGDVPVLFISGYTDDDVTRRGLLEAGQPFLQKPFTPEAVAARLGDILRPRGS